MLSSQGGLMMFLFFLNLYVFLKGFYEVKYKKNPFGLTRSLFFLGIFVWGDAVIFGAFWMIVSIVIFLLKNWYLFFLIISVFWTIRSFGEIIYWLNQQFSSINRNLPETLIGKNIFPKDSIWFVYQIFWQCVAVISIIFSIYFSYQWLK